MNILTQFQLMLVLLNIVSQDGQHTSGRIEDAMKWASVWEVSNYHKETLYIGHNGKSLLGNQMVLIIKLLLRNINKMSKLKYIYE